MHLARAMRALPGLALWAALGALAASPAQEGGGPAAAGEESPQPDAMAERRRERQAMVERQIAARGIRDPRVLAAMREVPRHVFVPEAVSERAYADTPLPIGRGQTISQPYIVALMTELAELQPGDRVLEIGTGSGDQAAVLATLGCRVWSIEIVEPLAAEAAARLAGLGYDRVQVRAGDGYRGWPEAAPFDAVLVTAAPPRIPEPLLEQLAEGGRLVAPVGDGIQHLTVVSKDEGALSRRVVLPVRFVPMTGEVRRREQP
jgi:protein-L-isoaspartate(D-aspartate) O-methyltransferase